MPLVLGVDSSTQATKVEVRDSETGKLVESARAPHTPTTPPRSEQDPHSWWHALALAVSQLERRREISSISIAGQQHGMVALDSQCRVIRPAKLWNDTESAPQARFLLEQLGPVEWVQRCGSLPVASLTITKVAWLLQNEPASYSRLAHLLLPHDWLTFQLTGELVTDRGDASGTGYWSPFCEDWDFDLLALIDDASDWSSRLPRVLGPTEPGGEVIASAAADLGIKRDIPVASGSGDNMAAALGLGLEDGDAAISIGTSGTAFAISGRPVADLTGVVAGFADANGRYLPLVCTLNAARVTEAFARILGVELEWLSRMALSAPPGAAGLVLIPYLDGERTPNLPDSTGTLLGIRSNSSTEEIARAVFEGVVCGLLEALDALRSAGVSIDSGRLVLTGGGARSEAYQRVVAELSGRSIAVAGPGEHVATGAALQAASVLTGTPIADLSGAWGVGETKLVEADLPERDEIRHRYRELVARIH